MKPRQSMRHLAKQISAVFTPGHQEMIPMIFFLMSSCVDFPPDRRQRIAHALDGPDIFRSPDDLRSDRTLAREEGKRE